MIVCRASEPKEVEGWRRVLDLDQCTLPSEDEFTIEEPDWNESVRHSGPRRAWPSRRTGSSWTSSSGPAPAHARRGPSRWPRFKSGSRRGASRPVEARDGGRPSSRSTGTGTVATSPTTGWNSSSGPDHEGETDPEGGGRGGEAATGPPPGRENGVAMAKPRRSSRRSLRRPPSSGWFASTRTLWSGSSLWASPHDRASVAITSTHRGESIQ